MDDRCFSYWGAGLTILGQLLVLPDDWSDAAKLFFAWIGGMVAGIGGPMASRAIRDWFEVKAKVRRLERRANEAEADLAYYKASHHDLPPLPHEPSETGDWTPPKAGG
jgi:hypothetical protein